MPGPLPKYTIVLSQDQEKELEHISQSYTLPFWEVQRSKILLLAHRQPYWNNNRIAKETGASCSTVRQWRLRWTNDKTIALSSNILDIFAVQKPVPISKCKKHSNQATFYTSLDNAPAGNRIAYSFFRTFPCHSPLKLFTNLFPVANKLSK